MRRTLWVAIVALCALMVVASAAYGAPTPPFDTNSECLECHSVSGSGAISKVDFEVPGIPGFIDYAKCRACHARIPDAYYAQGQWRGGHYHYGKVPGDPYYNPCDDCHLTDAFPLPKQTTAYQPYVETAGGLFQSAQSLLASPETLHKLHSGDNWINEYYSGYGCSNCHGTASCGACHTDAVAHGDHSSSTGPAPQVRKADGYTSPDTAISCVRTGCHDLAVAGTAAFNDPSCMQSCHTDKIQTHGYDTVDHVADDGMVEGIACSACHAQDLKTEHDKASSSSTGRDCGTCHPTPRNTITGSWDQSCVTAGCHTASSTAPYHAGAATAHAVVPAGEICLDCHDGTDLGSIHANATAAPGKTSCLVCHSTSTPPQSNDCTVCHFTFEQHYDDVKHRSSWTLENCNASGCHSSRDLMTVHNDHRSAAEGAFTCAGCHDSTRGAVITAIANGLTGCGDCHAGVSPTQGHRAAHWADPLLQDASGPNYSYYTGSIGTQPTGDCAGCHVSNVIDEHMGIMDAETGYPIRLPRKDRDGQALTCGSCHNSSDINVLAAIQTGQTKCDACHVTHGPIQKVHTSTFMTEPPVNCAASGCHTSGLVAEHNGGYTVTTPSGQNLTGCDVCHAYYETPRGTVVQDAIEVANDVNCTACHTGLMGSHPELGGHTATSAASLACGACHAKGATSIDIKTVHANASAGACAVCHSNPSRVPDLSAETAECASCHATEGSDYHRGLPAKHVYSAMPATCQSASCHPSNMLPAAHQAYVDGTAANETTCDVCHANPDPSRIPADATASCDSCHAPIHPNMDHIADASQECVDCHETGDVTVLHKKADGSTDCDVCHANPARVPALPSTVDCVNCHGPISPVDPNHYSVAPHDSNDGTQYGYACSTCHKLGMQAEHSKPSSGALTCVECHEQKVDSLPTAWNKTCAECHGIQHGGISQAHASATSACAGAGCHSITDVSTLHAGASVTVGGTTYTACRVCHRTSDSVPTSTTCTDCHDGHGDLTVAHTASGSSACVSCHETADVRPIHDSCATCHDGRTLPATVDCVNCHADRSPVDPNHYPAAAHLASETGCANCHYLDMKQEHFKASSGPVTCVACHEQNVDAFSTAWDKSCAACHPVKHGAQATKHVSTKTACGGSGCHVITDVADLHKGVAGGGCQVCHKSPSEPASTTDCTASGCHAGTSANHEEQHDTTGAVGSGCYGCHFRYLTAEHSALGYTCATCHNSTDPVVTGAIAANDRRCLTCHPDSAHNQRQATEFAPGNASMHRVNADLPGMRSSFFVNGATYTMSLPSASSFLRSGWTFDSIVTCDSCHTYSGAQGPHGAAMKVNIDPAYPNPYKVVDGRESFTAQLSANSPTGMSMSKNGSTRANIICEKCHVLRTSSGTWSNVAHKEHDDRGSDGAFCNQCHIAVPHGWGRPRLLGYTTDAPAYRTWVGTLAAEDGGLRRISLKSYTPNSWDKSDCGAACSSGRHPLSGSSWPNLMGGQSSPTTGTVSGKVTSGSGSAIPGATVTLNNGRSAVTGSDGTYSIASLSAGTYTATVTATGFTTWTGSVTVMAGSTATLNVTLSAAATNWARTGTATASSTNGSDAPSRAIDGSTSTYWRSNSSGTQWLRVDLGSSKSVSKVVVNWNGSYYARSYRIETSLDGTSWTSRFSTTYGTSGTKTHTFSAVSARYVRIYCTSANYGDYRVNEFEVWDF